MGGIFLAVNPNFAREGSARFKGPFHPWPNRKDECGFPALQRQTSRSYRSPWHKWEGWDAGTVAGNGQPRTQSPSLLIDPKLEQTKLEEESGSWHRPCSWPGHDGIFQMGGDLKRKLSSALPGSTKDPPSFPFRMSSGVSIMASPFERVRLWQATQLARRTGSISSEIDRFISLHLGDLEFSP